MPIFILPEKKILFIHIPKTGGSSVETYLQRLGFGMSMFSTTDNSKGCTPQHFHRDLLLEYAFPGEFDAVFTIVRDPVERFKSEYNFRMQIRQKNGNDIIPVSAWVKSVLKQYQENPFAFDNHLRPQSHFLIPGTRIYRYEQGLENAISGIIVDLGLQLNKDRLGTIPRTQLAKNYLENGNILTMDELVAIRRIYREDYELLDYPVAGGVKIFQ